MKDKFTDTKLAEELDLILLTTDRFTHLGLKKNTVGTLVKAYQGDAGPLIAQFYLDTRILEQALSLKDFRVLNERDKEDIAILVKYLIFKNRLLSLKQAF